VALPNEAAAQPEEPQRGEPEGQGADDNGLYDLSAVPEDIRPYVVDELKKIEANATRKFQEHADFRKQWEPYQELGVDKVSPEEMEQLLDFLQIARDEQAFANWWEQVGEEFGLFDDEEPEEDGEFGEASDENIEQVVKNLLDERLGPVEARLSEDEQEQRVQAAWDEIQSQLAALREEHGDFDEDAVCQLAMAYGGDEDAIQRGFEDFQRIAGHAERQFVEGNGDQPETPERGGAPSANSEPITDFAQATSIAKQRMAQAREEAAR
jgi:hypothetical protein